MYKVFKDSDTCNNILQAEFCSYHEATTFINGKLCEFVVKSSRNWWNIERDDDSFTIRINDMFTTYRIERG